MPLKCYEIFITVLAFVLIVSAALSANAASRAAFSVGAGPGCDFADLQEALASPSLENGDVLKVAEGGGYTGLTYSISNRPGELTIRGGFSDCSQADPDAGSTILDANGAGRVFHIEIPSSYDDTPMVIHLENLHITGGAATDGLGGGGVLVQGRPGKLEVNLRNVTVNANSAENDGGGVNVRINNSRLNGSSPLLTMDNESVLSNNTAGGNGGGLNCTSSVAAGDDVVILLGTVPIVSNAADNGGAVALDRCAHVQLYPGFGTDGIAGNMATDAGGAFYVTGADARLDVLGSQSGEWGDEANGGRVSGNQAARGGALYARGNFSEVHFGDIVIDNNQATSGPGGAILAEAGAPRVFIDRIESEPCPEVDAPGLSRCSIVRGNSATTGGGAFQARDGALIDVRRTFIHNNSGGAAGLGVVTSPGLGRIRLESVLATGNSGDHLVQVVQGEIELLWSTFADNPVSAALLFVDGPGDDPLRFLRVYGSILWEDDGELTLLGAEGSSIVFDCVIGWLNANQFDANNKFAYRKLDPEFTDRPNGNYFPGPTSPAIDYCDDFRQPPDTDIDGQPRGIVHEGEPLTVNPDEGPWDLGAWEARYLPEQIFADRFQSGSN